MENSDDDQHDSACDLKVTLIQFLNEFITDAYTPLVDKGVENPPKLKFLYRLCMIIETMDAEDVAKEFVKRTSRYWRDILDGDATIRYYSERITDGGGGTIERWRYNLKGSQYEVYVTNYIVHLFVLLNQTQFKESLWEYLYTLMGHAIDCIEYDVVKKPTGLNLEALNKELKALGH